MSTDTAHQKNIAATAENGVMCELDKVWVHSIPAYLKVQFPEYAVEDYQSDYPDAPLYSKLLEEARARKEQSNVLAAATVYKLPTAINADPPRKEEFAKVFGLGSAKAALNKQGNPIMIDVLGAPSPEFAGYIPPVDENYIFSIDLLKQVMMAVQLNKPMLCWGKHGTGKTTIFEQYFARTNRPVMRVQHTISTEEAHILGHYVVKNGSTVFEPGPLAIAMKYGLGYLADEYDFALPSVIAVYQPVLEGKRLIIKEASPEWRVIEPHPNFRFLATGNTNGGGDETGLYQGTQIQNAASYSRFALTVEVQYMPASQEAAVVAAQGGLLEEHARQLVEFADHVRTAFAKGDIGMTVSPRELINAAILARCLGGEFRQGLSLAFINRLNSTDKAAVSQFAHRIFAD